MGVVSMPVNYMVCISGIARYNGGGVACVPVSPSKGGAAFVSGNSSEVGVACVPVKSAQYSRHVLSVC